LRIVTSPLALRPLGLRYYRLMFASAAVSGHRHLDAQRRGAVAGVPADELSDVGLIAFAQFIPLVLAAPIGGVLADRMDRRRLLLAIQAFR